MPRSQPARPQRRPRRTALESLEPRQLLSIAQIYNPSYDQLIRAAEVRSLYLVDGSNLSAAVIDTGIDYTHPALGGGYGPGFKVSGGYDLAMKDADPRAESWSHGTLVAGLIGSSAPEASGVAPGANLIALRVFGNDNHGDFDRIADALQWVVDHHDKYAISVVNLSISDNGNHTRDRFTYDGNIGQRIAGLVAQLAKLRIPVVTAAGNSFKGQQGMGFTAILPGTISVTASDPSDRLWNDAQRLGQSVGGASATDLAAPGVALRTTGENGSTQTVEGTSFAAPLVTGAILLLQQIHRARFGILPTVEEIDGWLKRGADALQDSATGLTLGRLNLRKSAALVPMPPERPPSVVTIVHETPPPVSLTQPITPATTPNPTPPVETPTNPAAPTVPIRKLERRRLVAQARRERMLARFAWRQAVRDARLARLGHASTA